MGTTQEKAATNEPRCENCGKPLFGRTDKRFCNDGCRNAFNRKKIADLRAGDHENIPEIFRIIKKNYEILKSHGSLGQDKQFYFDAKILADEGFNFNFCTSVYEEKDTVWKFCFERGWCISGTTCFIMDRPEQAEV